MSVRSLRYNTATQHFTKSALASTDRDALAFLEAAQIYNTNQQRAIVNLVRSLKRVGLWSKMKAIYPFVGGTASSHKWNLKDPRDVDAAFRLTFSGGWTHSSTGADPNGTNATADTYFDNTKFTSKNDAHLSYYSRQDSNATEVEMGCRSSDSFAVLLIEIRTSGITYGALNSGGTYITFSDADARGMVTISRRASNDVEMYENSTSKITGTVASSITNSPSVRIGSFFDGTNAQFFSTKECAFATIGDGLTDSEATALYNIVDLYQKRLGRAV